ncbi:hypothetical protein EDD80_10772 [Anseongella ginsenosidimutans]|uniref:Phosphatase n=1 Tax=Anseongella ginsenosidimutans TaxID=496056 RepID=A0A4R3KQP4_9SPHI|nr:alkaline phosphatase PhoX [Anseongella ginsenosidimutans]QEC52617.1 DUF839 domain-containing protein [Anseongella ginsenosidimutans]TCS86539.1 hypothetical protein EDD80_10772 [Anseongella ginsenosidimutans]
MSTHKNTFRDSRRSFLKNSGIVSIGFLGLHRFALGASRQGTPGVYDRYGPLLPDPAGIMDLPKGFSYKIISRKGEKMADGLLSPGRNDAMATFQGPGDKVIIIRNHEITSDDLENGPFGLQQELLKKIDPEYVYDYGFGKTPSLGGTTTLVYNERSQKLELEYLSLAGTIRNCAGGPTPWGSWLTCEETYESRKEGQNEQDHGYVFEVPASAKIKPAKPVALKAMGRFNHEAVAVDPETGIVYETEDRHDGLIYRFIPTQPGKLSAGGKLQALAVKGEKSFDTRNWEQTTIEEGKPLDTEWIDLENVDSPVDDLHIRGFEQGAARFARGEGMWYGNNEVYFACTNGGKEKQGQVFRYIPRSGKLELFAEPNDKQLLRHCDNLTVSPWGDVVLSEDNESPRILGITPAGEIFHLAHNVGYESELAGVVFSPSGKTLFVNIQHAGLTLAITGDWKH